MIIFFTWSTWCS